MSRCNSRPLILALIGQNRSDRYTEPIAFECQRYLATFARDGVSNLAPPMLPHQTMDRDRLPPIRRWMRWGVYGMLGVLCGVAVAITWMTFQTRSTIAETRRSEIPPPLDADRAMGYLKTITQFGPRPSGSASMVRQQTYLKDFFTRQGLDVREQIFQVRHPQTGEPVRMVNLIASFRPDAPLRYVVAAHYDTRPFPDQDRQDPRGTFVGANDGASGVAAMMEWTHHLERLPKTIGVDLVMFDGEELVYRRDDDYFIGSTYFAQDYRDNPPAIPYRGGFVWDMIGDRELQIYVERHSLRYAKQLTLDVFRTANRLGINEFRLRQRHEVRDDHLPMNLIAKIPTVDLIDFDYPRPGVGTTGYWHTTRDVPEHCDGRSLITVVYVVNEYLRDVGSSAR